MIDKNIIDEIMIHATQHSPSECCGVIILQNNSQKYCPCENISIDKDNFIISPVDFAKAEDLGEVICIVHSHPISSPNPSHTDLVNIEATKLPWLIVTPGSNTFTYTEPSGFILPFVGRQFNHGIIDCYTLYRDYYKQVLNIEMKNYKRDTDWWIHSKDNLYVDNYEKEGFIQVFDGSIKEHDVLLMCVGSSKENHAAIYVGNNKILHHPMGRLSSIDVYGGWWQKITSQVIRHKDLV